MSQMSQEEKKILADLNKVKEIAQRDKNNPFRKDYSPERDIGLQKELQTREDMKNKGLAKLSLNEAYTHFCKPNKNT
jgi:hypothetical protein